MKKFCMYNSVWKSFEVWEKRKDNDGFFPGKQIVAIYKNRQEIKKDFPNENIPEYFKR